MAVVFIAAACSKPATQKPIAKPDGVEAIASPEADSPTAAPEEAAPGGGTRPKAGAQRVTGTKTGAATAPGNPQADLDFARKVGAMVRPQSTSAANRNSWLGVTDKEIKLGWSLDTDRCGVDTLVLLQAAAGVLPVSDRFYRNYPTTAEAVLADRREAIEHITRAFNDRAFLGAEPFIHIRPLMGNDPAYPWFGRKLVSEYFNGGSFQCPNTTNAGAAEAVKKYFAVVTDNLDGSAYNMSAALHAKKSPDGRRPMHFGTLWLADKFYNEWAPYSWTQFATGSTNVRQLASYVCSKLVGQKAANSRDFAGTQRKFGLLHPNLQEVTELAKEFRANLVKYCGSDLNIVERDYSVDPTRAKDEGNQNMVNFRLQNVTSIIMLTDLLFPLFHIIAAEEQQYHPEYVWAGMNYTDTDTVQRLYDELYTSQVDKASFGITNLGIPGGFGYEAGDPFWTTYHPYHQVAKSTGRKCDPSSDEGMNHSPNAAQSECKAPATIQTLFYSALAMAAGILFAGPDLNPKNVSAGLQSYPKVRFGGAGPTQDPRPAQLGSGPGKYGFIVDATEWRWRAKYQSPQPENKQGWVEWVDCQRHYANWPDELAVGWEKNGPNYNAWCGDFKYAPASSAEKDGYPRLN